MKKFISILSLLAVLTFSFSANAQQGEGLDPRIKAIGTMALYGTVGGTLLGTASLAFGTGGRSIAKGASLGLYAGLLFGGYVVISHAMRKHKAANPSAKDNYYPDTASPYEGGYEDEEGAPAGEQFFAPVIETDRTLKFESLKKAPNRAFTPVFYVPIFNYQF